MPIAKVAELLGLALRRPPEFRDRFMTIFEARWDKWSPEPPRKHCPISKSRAGQVLGEALQADIDSFLGEEAVIDLEQEVRRTFVSISRGAPFVFAHNADFMLAHVCYAVCRALKPEVVFETGVAYGVTTAFVLCALKENNKGRLYSVDLPPLGSNSDQYVGAAIPTSLKERWTLCRGRSRRLLPKLLASQEFVDMFIHDSLHTFRNMRWEFEMVTPHLRVPGVVIADDVELNSAFQDWAEQQKPAFWGIFEPDEKKNLFGAAVFAQNSSGLCADPPALHNQVARSRSLARSSPESEPT